MRGRFCKGRHASCRGAANACHYFALRRRGCIFMGIPAGGISRQKGREWEFAAVRADRDLPGFFSWDMRDSMRRPAVQAFTLVELLVVIAIISSLMALL